MKELNNSYLKEADIKINNIINAEAVEWVKLEVKNFGNRTIDTQVPNQEEEDGK